jgi:hypothetical protein
MLIQKALQENEVVTVKLTSGEELVTRYKSDAGDSYIVTKPLALSVMQDPQTGNQGIGFVPFTISADTDNDVRIPKTSVMLIAKSKKEAAAGYIKQTSSLTVPAAGLIT